MSPHPELFDDCRLVRPRGELDLTTTPAFAHDHAKARLGGDRLFLIVDLRGVTFMDGSVLDPLCAAWHDCRGRDGWIRVVHTGRGPGLVFRAVGLLARFPRYANVGDAWLDVPADCTAMARDT